MVKEKTYMSAQQVLGIGGRVKVFKLDSLLKLEIPFYFCLSVYLSLSLCLSLPVSLCLYLSLCLSLFPCLSVPRLHSLPSTFFLPFSLCVTVLPLALALHSLSLSLLLFSHSYILANSFSYLLYSVNSIATFHPYQTGQLWRGIQRRLPEVSWSGGEDL